MRGKEEYGFKVVSSLGDIEIDDENMLMEKLR